MQVPIFELSCPMLSPSCSHHLSHPVTARRLTASLCIASASLLAACSSPQMSKLVHAPAPAVLTPAPTPAPVIVYLPRTEAVDLAARHALDYQARLSQMSPTDLQREVTRLSETSATIEQNFDLALALGLTRNSGDLVKAQAILKQILANSSEQARAWHGLSSLLFTRYAEQRHAEESAERQLQQLRDAQRDSQRKIDQLNDKLQALKSIERSLNNRSVISVPSKADEKN
jgi:hypothetical protein